jgi:hypothetical protein
MRLAVSQRVQPQYNLQTMAAVLRDIETQLNQLSEGRVTAVTNARAAVPSGATQPYQVGDFVKNSTPSEVTAGGLSYVNLGWVNTVAGLPGTWEECRALTADPSGISSVLVNDAASDTTTWVVLAGSQTGAQTMLSDAGLTYNSSTNQLGIVSLTASGQLTSTLATGTAPFVIASTTKVANLNADLLDDQTGSYYLDSANFTGTNWTDLTDGGTTTLHTHTSGIASAITVANEATDTTCFPVFTTAATGDLGPKSNANLTFNSSTGAFGIGGAFSIAGTQVVTTRQIGWGTPSSTLLRTTFATYAGTNFSTSTYSGLFTDLQTLDDTVKGISQRLGALITDLVAHGLIGT